MENWRKFQEQQEEAAEAPQIKDYNLNPKQIKKLISMIQSVYNERYGTVNERDENPLVISKRTSSTAGLDSSSEMGKVYDRIEDVTRNIGRQVAPSTLETVKSAFPNSEMDSHGHLVIADKYVVSDENNLSDKAVNITNTNFFLDTVDNVHGKQLDLALESMSEEEVLRFLSEEIDRMISEGLLDEGLADFAKNIGTKARMGMAGLGFMAAAGGLPSTAQAEISPSQAATQISQVMNKKIDKLGLQDYHNIEVRVNNDDAGIKKLAKSVSDLTKTLGTTAKGDKDVVNMVTNKVIKVADKVGDEGNITNNDALNKAAEEMALQVDKINKDRKDKKSKKVVKGTQVDYVGAVANAYNSMQFAYAKGDEAAGKKAVDNLFDILDAAEKAGALDGKAAQAKKLLGKSDFKGFKKLMGY